MTVIRAASGAHARKVNALKKEEDRSIEKKSKLLDSAVLNGDVTVVVLEMQPTQLSATVGGSTMYETRVAIRTPNGRMSGIVSSRFEPKEAVDQ